MYHSFKLDEFATPPHGSYLRPDWLVNNNTPESLVPLLESTRSAPSTYQGVIAHPPPLMMPTPEEIADAAAAAAAAARSRRPKGTSAIGIEHFKSGVDDFDEWIELFECAVNLATKAPTAAEKQADYWEWLALRLDKPARAIFAQAKVSVNATAQAANRTATWSELKEALKLLLVDPMEKQKWHMKYMTVKWDGIESLHTFASRVVTSVNKFDKDMDLAYRTREFFLRFRMGLPKLPYQDAIDMNMSFEDGTIEFAKKIAIRAQLTQSNTGENQFKQVSFESTPVRAGYGNVMVSDQYVAVATPGGAKAPDGAKAPPPVYGNASMQDSRTSSLETSLAGIDTKLENLSVDMRSYNSRIGTLEKDVETIKRSGSSAQPQYPNYWAPPNQSPWYPPNYWPPQGGYTAPYRPPSPHRSNQPYSSNPQYRPPSPHRSNQPYRPPSPHRSNQLSRPPSPGHSSQQYQQPQQQFPNQQYPNQQYRTQSPNRSNPQSRPPSPRSGQRPPSPNRQFPLSPGKHYTPQTHPKQQHSGASGGNYRAIDTGDEASGYESEADPEVARLHAELEKAKAKAKAKKGGN